MPRPRKQQTMTLRQQIEADGLGPIDPPKPTVEEMLAAMEVSGRPDIRAPIREEDPRARAARRAQELRDHGGTFDETADKYHFDRSIIPPGWEYEWKTFSVLGKENPSYQVNLARAGWEAVPASRHPEMMPSMGEYTNIELDGQRLMERPLEINEESKHREYRKARDQVGQKEAQLGAAAPGEFDRRNKDQSLVRINRSYETIPIPSE